MNTALIIAIGGPICIFLGYGLGIWAATRRR